MSAPSCDDWPEFFGDLTAEERRAIDSAVGAMTWAEMQAFCLAPRPVGPIQVVVLDWSDPVLLPREHRDLRARCDALAHGFCRRCRAIATVDDAGCMTFPHHKLCQASDHRAARIVRRVREKHDRAIRSTVVRGGRIWDQARSYVLSDE